MHAASRSRRLLVAFALVCAGAAFSPEAHAATARVKWLPRGSGVATGFNVYVRSAGATYPGAPVWSGNPAPAGDGSMTADVTYTPAPSGTNYFSVVAVSSTSGETGLSGELPLGSPNPCRVDSCSSKTSCTFVNRDDGSSCDDGVYCNGPEVCVGGTCDTSPTRNCADAVACTVDACDEANDRCTHNGPPGCCSACDASDPCLAAACAQGDCSAPPGILVTANRWRFLNKAANVKLAARGTFVADPSLDPTQTGVVVEFQAPDGAVLYSSELRAQSIKAGSSGGRYRVVIPRAQSDFLSNGVTVFDMRVKDDIWSIVMKAESTELMDAFLEPTLTWVIRVGTTCARRLDLACNQTLKISTCAEPKPRKRK